MSRIAIIGGGVSGLTVAQLLKGKNVVTVFEKESTPGGLIRCKRVDGSLFHLCGGHVFNTKRQDVLDWFWVMFNREKDFVKSDRNSAISMDDGKFIPYPIENHIYKLPSSTQKEIISEWLEISKSGDQTVEQTNFEEFLKGRFGHTLYGLYFMPYNAKVWRRDLRNVPLSWLKGKLPMPTVEEMLFNNISQVKEKEFVHSQFWYERENGSQFIADRLAKDIDVRYNYAVTSITKQPDGTFIVGDSRFDKIVFCGNIKDIPTILNEVDVARYADAIKHLQFHGTTAVFCEIESNPYSWVYMPSSLHEAHRVICTGNFSPNNNATGKMTATIEFTDEIDIETIKENLTRIPFKPHYLTHHYSPFTYPIQDGNTREMIHSLKHELESQHIYITGRFADWEYYNMDAAMGAAIDLCKKL